MPLCYQRFDALLELVNILLGDSRHLTRSFFIHPGVSEFLPEFDGEEEITGNTLYPVMHIARIRWPVE